MALVETEDVCQDGTTKTISRKVITILTVILANRI